MTDREREQRNKASFVESELSDVLNAATDGYVHHCEYVVDGPNELVIVTLGHDSTLMVNVTADSPWAILKDVMKAVARRYE